jgi:hypothetical protein
VELRAEAFTDSSRLVEVEVSLPSALKISREAAEQFLSSTTYCSSPLSFEIIGLPGLITVQLVCHEEDRGQVRQQLKAHFPETVLTDHTELFQRHWNQTSGGETVIVDFGLYHEFMRPLRTYKGFEKRAPADEVRVLHSLEGLFDMMLAPIKAHFR